MVPRCVVSVGVPRWVVSKCARRGDRAQVADFAERIAFCRSARTANDLLCDLGRAMLQARHSSRKLLNSLQLLLQKPIHGPSPGRIVSQPRANYACAWRRAHTRKRTPTAQRPVARATA